MGGGRKQIFLGLGLVMVMGLAVYLRLWTIDYNFSSNETELLRYLSSSCFLFILPQKDDFLHQEMDFHFCLVGGGKWV